MSATAETTSRQYLTAIWAGMVRHPETGAQLPARIDSPTIVIEGDLSPEWANLEHIAQWAVWYATPHFAYHATGIDETTPPKAVRFEVSSRRPAGTPLAECIWEEDLAVATDNGDTYESDGLPHGLTWL